MIEPNSDTDRGLGVIIVTHDSAEVICGCIESLTGAFDGAAIDIVVVDSGSTDDTTARVRATFPDIRVVDLGANRGFGAGINAGSSELPASHDLMILNADVELAPGAGSTLRDELRDSVGICVPKLVDERGALLYSLRRDPTIRRSLATAVLGGRRSSQLDRRRPGISEEIVDDRRYERSHDVDWATGAVMLIGAACRAAVGAWDESLFLYSEETDYCIRTRHEGFDVRYVAGSTAVHIGGESATSPELWSILNRNKVTAYRRTHGLVPGVAMWMTILAGEAARALGGSARSRAATRELLSPTPRHRDVRRARETAPGWICFAAQDWWYHNHGHSDFQLMTRMARDRNVLFVNSIGMRTPLPGRSTQFARRILRKALSTMKGIRRPVASRPRFVVLSPLIVPIYGRPSIRRLNTWLVGTQVRLAARSMGITCPVVMVTIPTAWEVARSMERRALIFNRSDKHSAFDEVDGSYIRSLETDLLHHADAVLYVSCALMAEDAPIAAERSHFLDHGVDLEHFRPRGVDEIPSDIAAIRPPVIGFFGGIDDYVVDLELLDKVARRFVDASLVLIGDATCSLDVLAGRPNVHILGKRPYEAIPAYGSAFTVALMPWLQNEWIESCNPIKTKEYLALGLPIVTMRYPEAARYAHLMAVTDSHDEFLDAIADVLEGRFPMETDAPRRAVLESSWDVRTDQLRAIGERVI